MAGPLGGIQRTLILLTATPDELSAATGDWLAARCPDVERHLDDAVDAAEDCHDGARQTYIVSPQEPIEAEPGYEQDFTVFGRNDNGALDLDEDNDPVEPYGVGKISWD